MDIRGWWTVCILVYIRLPRQRGRRILRFSSWGSISGGDVWSCVLEGSEDKMKLLIIMTRCGFRVCCNFGPLVTHIVSYLICTSSPEAERLCLLVLYHERFLLGRHWGWKTSATSTGIDSWPHEWMMFSCLLWLIYSGCSLTALWTFTKIMP